MAVSAAAALLDELMGRNRNDGPNAQKKPVHWEDPEVIILVNNNSLLCQHKIFFFAEDSNKLSIYLINLK